MPQPTKIGLLARLDPTKAREEVLKAFPENVTYAQAAVALGVSVRQLHRLVALLELTDDVQSRLLFAAHIPGTAAARRAMTETS